MLLLPLFTGSIENISISPITALQHETNTKTFTF